MDMNTFFVLMFGLGILLFVVGLGRATYAQREIATHRQFIKLYFERAVEEYTEHKALQATLIKTLAERVQALEVYRKHHTERLNEFDEGLAQLDMLVNDYLDEQQSGLELESDALARRNAAELGPTAFDPLDQHTCAQLSRRQGDMIFTGSRPMPETMIDHARASWDSVHVDVDDYRDTLPGL